MNKFFTTSMLKSGVFLTLFISFIISMCIIFIFPFFFESYKELIYRLLVSFTFFFIMVTFVLLYVIFLQERTQKILKERRERAEKEVEKKRAVNERIKDIRIRFKEAIKILKNSTLYRNKRRARYELPWYLMVGQNNEGKTTLLEASGLDFPLNVNYDNRSIKEEGSTKHFQWYYAEHAVFIDMPGQYIHQKNSKDDSEVWQKGFLKLFAKKRSRRPINGIILNISVETFITKSEKELEQYGKDLRNRFDELSDGFVSSIPIYLIITKSDNIVGYNEYFASLNEDEKEEILGITFDNPSKNIDTSVIRPEFEKLLTRINSSVIDKLHHEWDDDSRRKILLFGDEFSNIFEKISMFSDICFAQTRYRKSLMLRGVYFTSVPEEQEVSSSYLLGGKKKSDDLKVGRSSRGYFIKKLLQNVILPESELIKMDINFKKLNQKKQLLVSAIAIAAVILLSFVWIKDFIDHNTLINDLEKKFIDYDVQKNKIIQNDDFEVVLQAINKADIIKEDYYKNTSSNFYKLAFYNIESRNVKLHNLYHKALSSILLPRVEKLLNQQILSNISNYDRTWKNTEAYLMLNNNKHRDNKFLKTIMATSWARLYPNKPSVQRSLNKHFDNLLKFGFKPYQLNNETLKIARTQLTSKGYVEITYNGLKQEVNETMKLKEFSFSQVLSTDIGAFDGSNYKIPGFYTKEGYKKVIVKQGKNLVKNVLQNNWVLGSKVDFTQTEINEIYAQVLSLYFKDYKSHWLSAINSLNVPEKRTVAGLSNQLETFSSADSPILQVIRSLKENTSIYTPAEELMKNSQKKGILLDKVAKIASRNALEDAKDVMSNTSVKNVREFFKPYNSLLNNDGNMGSELENTMAKVNEVFQELTSIYGAIEPTKEAYKTVRARIKGKHEPIVQPFTSLPTYVKKWFTQTLRHNWNYMILQSKNYIHTKYHEEVIPYYNEKLKGKYPIRRKRTSNNINIEDFNDFFRVNGILDSFFKAYISPFVKLNTKTYKRYRFVDIDGSVMKFNTQFMRDILKSYHVRKALFDNKGKELGTVAYIKPNILERTLATMQLDYDDNSLLYEHGPIKERKIKWPESTQDNGATFTLYDINNEKILSTNKDGQWALFKLIETFKLKKHSSTLVEFEYKTKKYKASMYIKGPMSKLFTKDNPLRSFKLNGKI